MSKVYVIADTHFGHAKIIDFEKGQRPFATIEEHDEALVDLWNSTVNKRDTVWHLGDVLFGKSSFALLRRLNGHKKLVMGNHDHYPTADYLEHFSHVFGSVKMKGCILSHVPVHPNQFYRFKGNIHGHTHSSSIDDRRYFCVSAEQIGLKPILLDTVIEQLDARLGEAQQ